MAQRFSSALAVVLGAASPVMRAEGAYSTLSVDQAAAYDAFRLQHRAGEDANEDLPDHVGYAIRAALFQASRSLQRA
ncbi:unnamed protein product, partial [Prorocentrum cordatum]